MDEHVVSQIQDVAFRLHLVGQSLELQVVVSDVSHDLDLPLQLVLQLLALLDELGARHLRIFVLVLHLCIIEVDVDVLNRALF